ncbi:MAG TPA: cation-translocating P-type ATPase [Methanospirillum sp.]|nr:cation-translocating P-type ATPase [Methanospirillum sp.]
MTNTKTEFGDACSHSCGCSHDLQKDTIKPLLIRIAIAGFCILISIITELGFLTPPEIATVSSLIALALTAYPILKEAITGLLKGERNVCELASLAIVAAIIIGEFTAAAEIAIILTVGELIEAHAYARTRRDIEGIITHNPRFGLVIRDGSIRQVNVDDIVIGDQVMVRPGDRVPVDGIIGEGHSSLDESCLTGESLPQVKGPGSPVYSGSMNQDGTIILNATKKYEDSTYSRIVHLVHDAGLKRPPSHPFIDRFSHIYTPLMLIIAGIVLVLTGSIIRAITVLIVACPCALLLATPSAVLASLGVAAKNGILIKGGEFLEICQSITVIVLDKTGTITSGRMQVDAIVPYGDSTASDILEVAARAECSSSHPVALAIISAAREKKIAISCSGSAHNHPGLGIVDLQNEKQVHVGNLRFMHDQGIEVPDGIIAEIEEQNLRGTIVVLVSVDRNLIGMIRLVDTIRPETESVITQLRIMGNDRLEILTGDSSQVANGVAIQCGISIDSVHSGMYPQDKENYIAELQQSGNVVCFVGDGTNDGPALARANLGISIGSREDTIALETSNVILMKGDLKSLPAFITLGKRTGRIILMNVILALLLNMILICGAVFGVLSPAMGAIGHQVATLAVLLNASRLIYQPIGSVSKEMHLDACDCVRCVPS